MSEVESEQIEGVEGVDTNDSPQLTEIETLASKAGWKPAGQWKGDGHQSAEDFLLHRAKRADEASKEVRNLQKRMDKVVTTMDKLHEKALDEQRAELEGRLADAVANNKPGEAHKISRQIDSLNKAPDDPAADFKERNSAWFGVDEEASAFAVGICQREADKGRSHEQQLEAAEAAVKKKFPELFGEVAKEEKKNTPAVGAPGSRVPSSRAKNYDNLPPEAKSGCESFVKRMRDSTPEKVALFRKNFADTFYKENT